MPSTSANYGPTEGPSASPPKLMMTSRQRKGDFLIQKENLFVELLNLAEEIQESPDGILAIVYQILVDENLKALLHPFCRESRIPVPAPEC